MEQSGSVDRSGAINVKGKRKDPAKKPFEPTGTAFDAIEPAEDPNGDAASGKRAAFGRIRYGKLKGIRDKRDKKGDGNGRRRMVNL